MASLNKEEIRDALNRELQEKLFEFMRETLEAAGQNFDELDKGVKKQMLNYAEKEAEKLAQGIVNGLEGLRQAIVANTNKIIELESRLIVTPGT